MQRLHNIRVQSHTAASCPPPHTHSCDSACVEGGALRCKGHSAGERRASDDAWRKRRVKMTTCGLIFNYSSCVWGEGG